MTLQRRKSGRRLVPAVAGTAVAAGVLALLPSGAQAQPGTPRPSGAQADFTAAAVKYDVPVGVLMGVTREESGWQSHPGYSDKGGYGLGNLTDVTTGMLVDGAAGAGGRADLSELVNRPGMHTLRTASKLTGIPASRLKTDAGANLEGTAALLASYQKTLTGGLSENPSDWTAAVARYSRLTDEKAATGYVDDVFGTIASGAEQKTADGTLRLAADEDAEPELSQLDQLDLKSAAATATTGAECPSTMNCTYAPVAVTGSNGQVSNRPANGIQIDRIVLHTAEGSFASALATLSATGATASAHYLMDTDGSTTQLMPVEDIAYAVGNYHYNLHSVSIEHAGFTAQGAQWYTDATYRQTAELVSYLAQQYGVPLDRQHVLGHDNVPGSLDSNLAKQHWDPGTAWDWNRFMKLLGAPTDTGRHGVGEVGSVVTIAPRFEKNIQSYTVCPADDPTGATTACGEVAQPSNSLFVRQAPDADAPLLLDPDVHPALTAGTDGISDWSDRVQAGQQFVVADRQGDWTAIWYDGQEGWIHNPCGRNTVPTTGVTVIKAVGPDAAPLYGQAYPAASEYPAGLSPSRQVALTAPGYRIPVGQAYVVDQPAAQADDFFTSGAVVKGAVKYYQAQFNNRTIYVNAADVTATEAD
ncbi:N-acetylmuramoyl-L-alanine amidase [Streptomyces sp. NPDC047061]|uniref:N-acetylmuramoyl-L-alanine amidase n=1 Tax=Streptomyces sp. NPDC047061 TaxID=3154605 RepID=UPI0033F3E2BE